MINSGSLGKYYNNNIKGKYKWHEEAQFNGDNYD